MSDDFKEKHEAAAVDAGASGAGGTGPEPRRYAYFALGALVLCVAAWIVAAISGFGSVAVGCASIIAGACALGSKRPLVRNTSITCIIASGVLVVVVVAFIVAVDMILA